MTLAAPLHQAKSSNRRGQTSQNRSLQGVSIVVPTYNEQENIRPLLKRLHTVMEVMAIPYELIFVDDHSTDRTEAVLEHYSRSYPIRVFRKDGPKGKAYSLLQGFHHVQYDLICMIDADLQYPPESLPAMLQKIHSGADVVVANRQTVETSWIRTLCSRGFRWVFGKLLHQLDVDVQSGLKVFRKEILTGANFHPSPWTFDLEFLLHAKLHGYHLDGVDITFHKRQAGEAKIQVLKATFEIGWSAINLKLKMVGRKPLILNTQNTQSARESENQIIQNFREIRSTPTNRPSDSLNLRSSDPPEADEFSELTGSPMSAVGRLEDDNILTHTTLPIQESAALGLTRRQKSLILLGVVFIGLGFMLNWFQALVVITSVVTTIYFLDLLFNLVLVYRGFLNNPEIDITEKELRKRSKQQYSWPAYTVLCPLYKEWQVVPQFVEAMVALDYPKDKLQVMLLLEADDQETIDQVQRYNLPEYFEVVVVPHSQPKTKPKACNYGLLRASGDLVVIYDAEDIPEPDQLKKAVLSFEKSSRNTACVQAKLNFYNINQNLLTRLFTAEYSLWFDLVLTGLQSIQAPIPLGGTSNHFRTALLKQLHGWDAYNVTEDCDLGMRLFKQGYLTTLMDSTTYEEANSDFFNWFRQRPAGSRATCRLFWFTYDNQERSLSIIQYFTYLPFY